MPGKGAVSCPSLTAFFPGLRTSELLSQHPVHGGNVEEGGVKRRIGTGDVGDPCCVFGVVRMRRVGQGVHDLLVAGESAGVFQRPAAGAIDQPGRRTVVVPGPAGNQLEPVKPAVTKVVFVKRFA